MFRFFAWIKTHKLLVLLLLVIGYLIYTRSSFRPIPFSQTMDGSSGIGMKFAPGSSNNLDFSLPDVMSPREEAAPAPNVTNRLVISESYLSLLVNNVVEVQKRIIQTAESFGGYMVNSNLNNPQDAPSATVTVRVPAKQLNLTLDQLRGLAVKVISENLSGEDVTDQFVDNEARLQTLLKTKAKFEEILDKATQIQDILNVQREIINLQSQIDALKGQQNYLEKNAEMAKLTIYLSTDELALPYAPSETWRPQVIFKQAIRSVISKARQLGTLIIWIAVYSVIWIPALLLIYFLKRKGYLNFLK